MSKQPQMKIRFLNPLLHDWIKEQAAANKRTLNGEVNYHLEQAMLKQQQQQEHQNEKQPHQHHSSD